MNKDEQFFYDHAGWSYDPKTETSEQGRIRCARELAQAEADARGLDYTVTWEDDFDWARCAEDDPVDTCEWAGLYDSRGQMLASLGMITDATPEYRRVIEAELAAEALHGAQVSTF